MLHLILSLLMLSTSALADLTATVGIGKGVLEHNGTPFDRMASLGYQIDLPLDFYVRPQAGYFLDISGVNKSSFWGTAQVGVKANTATGAMLNVGIGPSYLQNPDGILGGHFQFTVEGGAGIQTSNTYIGLAWIHISSAGIEMPNQGRDFLSLQLRFNEL